MNDLTSIIIVNFRVGNLLEECIESIVEQHVEAEVIIVDNASGDDDRKIIERLSRKFAFVKAIFNKKNQGFSKANNQGLAISIGTYVLFLNPDTFLFPSCLEHLVSFMKKNKRIGCITPKLWMDKRKTFLLPPSSLPTLSEMIRTRVSASNSLLINIHFKKWLRNALTFWNSRVPMTVDAVSGAFLMMERSVLGEIGYFDERFPLYFEDSDLCMRIKKAGLKLWYYPDAEAVHYYNQSAKDSSEAIQKFIASEKLYLEKYYGRLGLKFISLLNRFTAAKKGFRENPSAFLSPINTSTGDYLLFSPIKTMIPCAAHKVTSNKFIFDQSYVDNLARGMYYSALVSRHGKIFQRIILEKK